MPAFHLYYPAHYDSLASLASVQLPDIAATVQQTTGVALQGIPQLVIYPAPDQLYESNIGMYEQALQTFPTVNLKGNRVLLAFNGSYEQFCIQLKEAWIRLVWEEQLRNDTEEQLSSNPSRVPGWFRRGLISYWATGWSAAEETALYQYYKDHPGPGLLQPEQLPAGAKAFCYFLEHRYRKDALFQLFFQLRQGKSLARAARLVTKRPMDTLLAQCDHYYRQRAATAAPDLTTDTLSRYLASRLNATILSLQTSSDRQRILFTTQRHNRRKVYVINRQQLQQAAHFPKPFARYLLPPWLEAWEQDQYPYSSWQDEGKSISVVLPEKGKLHLKLYSAEGAFRDSRILYGADGVSYAGLLDRNRWLLAAARRGRSDLVSFDPQRLRYTLLTVGTGDHTEPALVQDYLVYRSGYPADSLYHKDSLAKPYGIYYRMIDGTATTERAIVTDSAWVQYHNPAEAGERLSLDNNRSGLQTRDTFLFNGNAATPMRAPAPWLQDYLQDEKAKDSISALLKPGTGEPSFLEKVLQPGDNKKAAALHRDSLRKVAAYSPQKVKPYLLQLYSAYFSAQINNDYYINRYQPYQAYLGNFKFPETGAMIEGGFSDLLENHQFNIGYRMPAGSEGSDFFVRYANTARRLDWHVLFHRKVESLQPDPERNWLDKQGNPYPAAAKVKTHYYELGFHYPLLYDWSLDFTTAARRDRTVFLASDRYSLNYEALQSWWSISSLSLKVTKLKPTLPFLYRGWSAAAIADGMASTGEASTILYGGRIDASWHQPLFRGITFVARAQAGYSGGESRILYTLGGTDNNLVPRLDTSVRFAQSAPYAFLSLVTPLRGYVQNSIYGGSFGLLNADLYVPLFQRLIPWRTGFSSINNLQMGLFTDIAATGQVQQLPGTNSPVYAFGFSARTFLAGYPLRFDMAWPGSFDKQPVWYLSLSLK